MKNYFQDILSLFTGYDYPGRVNQHFYRWLTDSKHENEKDEALRKLYSEAETKGDAFDLEKSLERWRQNNIISATSPQRNIKQKPSLRFWQSVAAVLLIISVTLGYHLFYNTDAREYDLVQQFVPTTQMKTILLPDGSQVQMNSMSTLLYPRQFAGKNRSVYLIGEANFKVKPDKNHPFIVKTDGVQVTALGTEFNVSAYSRDKDICTTLISGSILVEYENQTKQTLLRPGQELVYNKDSRRCALNYPNMEDVTAWQRGELVFRQMKVADIITILERGYDYKFIYSLHDLKNDLYSFRFKENATLPEVMDVIVDVTGDLSFKIENNKCYIIEK